MANIRRPEFIRGNTLPELLRWNKHTTDNIDSVNAPSLSRCGVTLVGTASAADSAVTVVALDTELYASGYLALHSSGGIICGAAGYVQVCYGLQLTGSALGSYRGAFMQLARTALNDIQGRSLTVPGAIGYGASGAGVFQVEADDIIQLAVQQDSGGALVLSQGARVCNMYANYLAFL
jgi:hypothetical protein